MARAASRGGPTWRAFARELSGIVVAGKVSACAGDPIADVAGRTEAFFTGGGGADLEGSALLAVSRSALL